MSIYNVIRTYTESQYLEVDAESEDEAIELAKKADNDDWENNPNDEFLDNYEYIAELIESK